MDIYFSLHSADITYSWLQSFHEDFMTLECKLSGVLNFQVSIVGRITATKLLEKVIQDSQIICEVPA